MFKGRILTTVGLIVLGGILGLGLAGFSASMIEKTNRNKFCVSCHEMTWPQATYQTQPHFNSRSGVRPGCSNCHVPHHPWYKMMIVKASQGTRDIWLHLNGKLDTEEKYQAHRAELAERVWARLKASDSDTCRGCHIIEAMDPEKQSPAAALMHARAREGNITCIECHKGIGHGDRHEGASGG